MALSGAIHPFLETILPATLQLSSRF
jgi:hypothetical protein